MRGLAYDSLGSGYTERRGARAPITRDDHRALLMAVAAVTESQRFRAVAHSMGAGAALGAAWRHPRRVAALLLSAPATLGRRALSPTVRLARFRPTADTGAGGPGSGPPDGAGRLRVLPDGGDPAALREREAAHALARPREQVRGFVDIAGHGDLRRATPEEQRYRQIAQPVWIVRGEGDLDWMPRSHEERYGKLIPHSRVLRWRGVGHSPQIEAPERFAELILDFLEQTQKKARDPGQGGGRAR